MLGFPLTVLRLVRSPSLIPVVTNNHKPSSGQYPDVTACQLGSPAHISSQIIIVVIAMLAPATVTIAAIIHAAAAAAVFHAAAAAGAINAAAVTAVPY